MVSVFFPLGTLFPTIVVFGPVGLKEAAGDFLSSINSFTKGLYRKSMKGRTKVGVLVYSHFLVAFVLRL